MNLIINDLKIPFERDGISEYRKVASQKLNIGEKDIRLAKILNKKLDIKDQNQFYYDVSIVVSLPEHFDNNTNFPEYSEQTLRISHSKARYPRETMNIVEQPIIVGFGPAGLFAALELVELGFKPIIFERGKRLEERSVDVERFIRERVLDPESNIQFGEGGAGAYSDGKLFSRGKNSPYINKVLETFIKFGAPEEIAYAEKPHLGTDVLCRIVRNMREYLLQRGAGIYYGSKVTEILISEGKVSGVVVNGEKEYRVSAVFLAVGHSARDTFEMIREKSVALEQKPISVGIRIEHPAEEINLFRYGPKYNNYPGLGAATYSFNHTDREKKRAVNTFCMCPGGEVVNASSENGFLVLNGMSYSKRNSPFSNSALIVTCRPDDYGSAGPLAGIEFQKDIERKAFIAGGGKWQVPAQNLTDFLSGKISAVLNANSCKMGAVSADISGIFPKFVLATLLDAFAEWEKEFPSFLSKRAIVLAAETRTSCPVRIKRNEKYESVNIQNLYPIGEGAGYTGGITSSAADAIKAVEASLCVVE